MNCETADTKYPITAKIWPNKHEMYKNHYPFYSVVFALNWLLNVH